MGLHEIVLPETKPETEWVRSRALQKVSPTYSHAVLQRLVAEALGAWSDAGERGRVGTEWRFRVPPPGEIVRPLVPDVAFLAYEVVAADASPERYETPLAAPTVAAEILSPDDRAPDVADKVAAYISAGSRAVFVVDTVSRAVRVHDGRGDVTTIRAGLLEHAALPGFSLDVAALFLRALGPPAVRGLSD